MKNGWNWNDPITWKQSIIFGLIGAALGTIGWVITWYGNKIETSLRNLYNSLTSLKKKD